MSAKSFLIFTGTALALGLVGVAEAAQGGNDAPVLRAITMDDLAETLLLEGLRFSRVPIDGKGIVANTRLDVSDGVEWSVLGYACAPKTGCGEVQMRAVFSAVGARGGLLARLNAWNAQNRFTRAYLSPGKSAILEMDIYLNGGLTLKNIRAQIAIWRQSVRRFSSTMTGPEKPG